jgi:hypothetical protein
MGLHNRLEARMDDQSQRARRFDAAMLELYETWRREVRYSANRFRKMVDRWGGVETARRLLSKPDVSSGFMKLKEAGRLDLTMEYLILQRDFTSLFSFEERGVARGRLIDHGMAVGRLP